MHRIVVLLTVIILSSINTTISKTFFVQNDTEENNRTKKSRSSYTTDINLSLSPTVSSNLETKYLAESGLVQNLLHGAYMNGFGLLDFLESLQPSHCLQVCLDEVASMLDQPFAGQYSIDEAGNICSHFDIFQRCLHHNTSCKDALLDVTTAVINHLCTFNQDAFGDMFQCLYGHSVVIYFTCDAQCKIGEILSKASKKKDHVTNIHDGNGNTLLEMINFYDLCSASACFIKCTQDLVEKECSIGHSTLLHKIVAAVVNHTIKMMPTTAVKSSDAYTLLVSSILPNECRRLKLFPQDLIFTTPTTDFSDGLEYKSANSVIKQKTTNFEENDAIRTIPNSHAENQTNSVYMQILPLSGHQMKLQCQMIDLETGQQATVADIATLMTTDARNIFHGLRSVEDDQILENNANYDNRSALQDRKTISSKSEVYAKASSDRSFPSGVLNPLLVLLLQICLPISTII
ncbi:unnamed protein product [Cercopithifilaria johnstoni]|uniref:Chondroitin proteoglycan 4 domain-containing protein n=1 Tax=Cercopithifilaria johnstoni TaxID=2874296 RepID=A0A8J2PYJ1_9BILA|nr:unnamed protein product [Cercopithifilaria johnstoni]